MSVLCDCEYAIRAHAISARQKGASEEQIDAANRAREGAIHARRKFGFRAAEKIHQSGKDLDDDLCGVKVAYTDTQIVELIAAASIFEFFPRFVDGLRIPTPPPPTKT